MKATEFQAWVEFWKVSPFDDEARHFRPAALIAQAQAGWEIAPLLRWLHRAPAEGLSESDMVRVQKDKKLSDVDVSFLRTFGLAAKKKGNS